MRECPCCGLSNHPSARSCDCGYDFKLGRMKRGSPRPPDRQLREGALPATPFAALGAGFLVGGIVIGSLSVANGFLGAVVYIPTGMIITGLGLLLRAYQVAQVSRQR